ncbi:unnamed protein product, partial [Didymodactylos carnosus]
MPSTISKFEQLPNEILYDIFDYLNSNEIYNSFYYLNKRFQLLLNNRYLHFKCSTLIRLDDLFDYIIPYINTKQIKALTIEDGNQTYFPSQSDLMKWFFTDISTTIQTYDSINRLNLTKIFHLTNLKYLSLFSKNDIIPNFGELQLQSYQQSSSIEYLTIKHSGFYFSELGSLFTYMPKLKYLDLNLIKPYEEATLFPSFMISQDLKEIKLSFDHNDIS